MPPVRRSQILASNILLINELEELLRQLDNVPVMLLKGGALLISGCREYAEREMGDLDLLIHPRDWNKMVGALERMGYEKLKTSTGQYRKNGAAFDLHDRIWYLDDAEMQEFWRRSEQYPMSHACSDQSADLHQDRQNQTARIPAPEDLLIHVLAHAAVHHGEAKPKWVRDVRAILEVHAQCIDLDGVRQELERLGLLSPALWFLQRGKIDIGWNAPETTSGRFVIGDVSEGSARWMDSIAFFQKGHILRFLYLRDWRFRARYLRSMIFPAGEFLKRRYDLQNSREVLLWRLLRPVSLAISLGRAALHINE